MAKVATPEVDVIGFDVCDASGKPVSRRYAVRDAAETFASLMRKDGAKVYVRSVTGFATPQFKHTGRKR